MKWLDSWEKEVTDNVNKALLERKAHLGIEKTVQDNQTRTMYNRGLKESKEQVQQDKDAIKNIKKQFAPFIAKEISRFLSDSTGQALRMTLTSIIQLSHFLLHEVRKIDLLKNSRIIKIDYILTRKLNQDFLEVTLNVNKSIH